MPAPAYNSYKWIQEDWRYLKFKKGLFDDISDITYDKRCGEREKDGKIRLCLPRIVIVRLLRTKKGRTELEKQMKKKLASKTKKVPWNETIRKAMRKFTEENKAIKNDPKKRNREVRRNRTKPNVWHVRYAQVGSSKVIQNKYYRLKRFTDKSRARDFFKKEMKTNRPFMKFQILSVDKSYNTYYK